MRRSAMRALTQALGHGHAEVALSGMGLMNFESLMSEGDEGWINMLVSGLQQI